jgi:tRNA dimethylallyltransferase
VVQQKILVILGPTAVGKTELSLDLARQFGGEIISADSMQVYRGLDIGTAKPSPEERRAVVHHLVDVVDPDTPFNVADYVRLAEEVLAGLKSRKTTAILSGGTGLYIDALLQGFLFPDASADAAIRSELEQQAQRDPLSLFEDLKKVDPLSAKRLHPHDLRRIIRALEVYRRTGEPISLLQRRKAQEKRPYQPVYIGLWRDRPDLYARVNRRVDAMIQAGLVDEVAGLVKTYPEQPTALQALGYKEIACYLRGETTLEEAIERLKRDTRRYAKRQLSWFKRNRDIRWFNRTEITDERIKQEAQALWEPS